mmetsp:Transcript_41424/g.74293  ORF Transcript_41424/g.74293 Transcript_41424/m.74293 type:complete len:285 (-) Transcript_41424:202-1056(-)
MSTDTSTVLDESMWFDAAANKGFLRATLKDGLARNRKSLDVLDLFGASQNVKKAFAKAGHKGFAYDIKLDEQCDLCSKMGCSILADLLSQMKDGSIIVAGPPCSLFGFMSSSVHKRNVKNVWGDQKLACVRVANRIVWNFVAVLDVLHDVRGSEVHVLIEQPTSSWMFKLPPFRDLIEKAAMHKVPTCMGAFGHDMMKPSHLLSTLPNLETLRRKRTKELCAEVKKRMADSGLCYYWKDENGGINGGKHLQSSADYTAKFCNAILNCWKKAKGAKSKVIKGHLK